MKRLFLLITLFYLLTAFPAHAAEVVRYVNTDNTCDGDEDGTTNETDGSTDSAYCDLATWDATEATDLVSAGDTHKVIISGTAADTSGFEVGTDWTSGSSNCITITTDSGVSNSIHEGEFPTDTYRLVTSDYFRTIEVNTGCVHIDGLAVKNTANDDARGACIEWTGGTELHIINTICAYEPSGTPTTSNANFGIRSTNGTTSKEFVLANSIIYGQNYRAIGVGTSDSDEVIIYNNTVSANGATAGAAGFDHSLDGTTDIFRMKNNICQGTADCYMVSNTADTDTSTTNLSEDADVHGTSGITSATVTFVDEANDDYHLDSADASGALGGATDLSADSDFAITDDIDEETRSDWDIGADEENTGGGGGGPPPAEATDEICGDGVDNDMSGGDSLCSTDDQDRDGYDTDDDCDDTDRYIYPGIYDAAGCVDGYRLCQVGGAYSSCTANGTTPLCEATGGGSCYYVDFDSGDDGAAGTYAAPWASTANFTYYGSGGDPAPAGHISLTAGDVVYFLGSSYTTIYQKDTNSKSMFSLRTSAGTASNQIKFKAYPGETPEFDGSGCTTGMNCTPFSALQTSYLLFEGLAITGGCNDCDGSAMSVAEADNIEIRNMELYDWNAADNNNIAGLKFTGVTDSEVHHNHIHDNYDRVNTDTGGAKTENSANIVIFTGDGNNFHHNVIYHSIPTTNALGGSCFKYKHGSSDGDFEFNDNVLYNCSFYAIATGQRNGNIRRNVVLNSTRAMYTRDLGGPTFHQNITVENNTFYNSRGGLEHNPSNTYAAIGPFTFRFNVIVDDAATYSGLEGGMLITSVYGSDSLYIDVVEGGKLTFQSNCYYNTNAQVFQAELFSSDNGGNTLGDTHTLATWQALGYDTLSFDQDPVLNASHIATASVCEGFGWDSVSESTTDPVERFRNIRARQIPRRR